jgi:hypothetical protein
MQIAIFYQNLPFLDILGIIVSANHELPKIHLQIALHFTVLSIEN